MLTLLLALAAHAAPATGPVPSGTHVRIVDVSREDAYRPDRRAWIGRTCVADEDLIQRSGGWYGGQMTCDDDEPYFYAVRVEVTEAGAARTSPGTSASAPPAGDRHTGPIAAKSRVLVTDIGSEDAYYSDRQGIIGITCDVPKAPSEHDVGWYSGPAARCSDGESYYFYAAAMEPVPGKLVRKGVTVFVTDAPGGGALVGRTCTVATKLKAAADGTYAGDLSCGGTVTAVRGVRVRLP